MSGRLGYLAPVLLTVAVLVLSVQRAPAASAPWVLYLEAEDGEVGWPMERVHDVQTSGCAYLRTAVHVSGAVTLTLTVPVDGNYYPWARVMGTGLTNNSFFFSVDGGQPVKYEFLTFHGMWTWGWDRVHVEKTPQTTPLTLSAGQHTLTFSGREVGARLDALVLTNDLAYIPLDIHTCPEAPTPGGPPTPTPTRDPNAPYLWQCEAERGVLAGPMVRGQDPLASACEYVYTTQHVSGSATFTFTVPVAGNYYPWARAKGSSLNNNSFFFSVDGSAPAWFEIPYEYGDWTWMWARLRLDLSQPYDTPLYLTAGTHTLVFGGREVGSWLDAVLITGDRDYEPMFQPGSSVPCAPSPHATATPTPTATATPALTLTPAPLMPFRLYLPGVAG